MRKLICILLAALLAACSKEPVSVSGTDNKDIAVAELFTHKGVTIFRFYDGGRWAVSPGSGSATKSPRHPRER
jgi:hypothetical protein